jgi:hypothetical protein
VSRPGVDVHRDACSSPVEGDGNLFSLRSRIGTTENLLFQIASEMMFFLKRRILKANLPF